MKKILKNIVSKYNFLFDIFGIIFFGLSAFGLKIYKLLGVKNLKYSTKLVKLIGIFPIRNHYYEPQFKNEYLRSRIIKPIKNDKIFRNKDLNLKFLNKLKYSNELKEIIENENIEDFNFDIDNPFFSRGDADFLYQFIRYTKPKKIIEDCRISLFETLEDNDLLIIDSTHIIKPFGDVLKIYQEIIPNIKKKVNICIHDIFTPYSYPEDWIIDHNLFWNEQYLLECLLMNKNQYQLIAPLYYLKKQYYSKLKYVCPYLNRDSKPSSFYIRKN